MSMSISDEDEQEYQEKLNIGKIQNPNLINLKNLNFKQYKLILQNQLKHIERVKQYNNKELDQKTRIHHKTLSKPIEPLTSRDDDISHNEEINQYIIKYYGSQQRQRRQTIINKLGSQHQYIDLMVEQNSQQFLKKIKHFYSSGLNSGFKHNEIERNNIFFQRQINRHKQDQKKPIIFIRASSNIQTKFQKSNPKNIKFSIQNSDTLLQKIQQKLLTKKSNKISLHKKLPLRYPSANDIQFHKSYQNIKNQCMSFQSRELQRSIDIKIQKSHKEYEKIRSHHRLLSPKVQNVELYQSLQNCKKLER